MEVINDPGTGASAKKAEFESIPTLFDSATRVQRGFCPVLDPKTGVEGHSLYFERHGIGPEKVVFIMGYVLLLPPAIPLGLD